MTIIDPTNSPGAARPADPAAERLRLVTLMAAMAEGDQGAVFALVAELGHHLAGTVRAQLRSYGRHDLLRDEDEVQGLVHTAAFEILDRAGSWDPDGAPPWVWARNAIHAAVVREIGHASVELEIDLVAGQPPLLDDLDDLERGATRSIPGVPATPGSACWARPWC